MPEDDFELHVYQCELFNNGVTIALLRNYFSDIGFQIGEDTLRKELKRSNFTFKSYSIVPTLTENHKSMRLEHARNLIEADITNYVFSDEAYVRLFEDRSLTWSKSGLSTKKLQPNKWKTSIMIWGGFHRNKENFQYM